MNKKIRSLEKDTQIKKDKHHYKHGVAVRNTLLVAKLKLLNHQCKEDVNNVI